MLFQNVEFFELRRTRNIFIEVQDIFGVRVVLIDQLVKLIDRLRLHSAVNHVVEGQDNSTIATN